MIYITIQISHPHHLLFHSCLENELPWYKNDTENNTAIPNNSWDCKGKCFDNEGFSSRDQRCLSVSIPV